MASSSPGHSETRPWRVAALQMVSKPDVEENLLAARRLIREAVERGAEMVSLPENYAVLDCGPVRRHAEPEGEDAGPLQAFLAEQARQHGVWLLGGTIPLTTRPGSREPVAGERVRASSLLYDPQGRCVARYDKIHLFDVDVADAQSRYRESDTFEPGGRAVVADTPAGALGLTVCYDMRFPELYRTLTDQGARMVTVPSAFTRVTGQAHWEPLLRARAIENQVYVIAPGQGGRHNEKRETWGHSMIIDPWGRVLACHETGEGVAMATVDPDFPEQLRGQMPVASHRRHFATGEDVA